MERKPATRAIPLVALTSLTLLAPAFPGGLLFALPPENDKWIRVQTAHFTLYSDASERRTLDLGRRLERFRAVLAGFYKKFHADPPVTTSVYVFRNDQAFTPYKIRFHGRPADIVGLFAGAPDGNYIEMNGDPGVDPLEIIYHEYMHHFLETNLHHVPTWFSEGVAECYGTFRADDKSASVGLTQNRHVLYLRQHELIPLGDLFGITPGSPVYNEGERQGVFYAESWALVHYLMWDKPERRAQLGRFLDRLSDGENPDGAFTRSFETTYEAMENELRAHVRQRRFQFSVVPLSDLQLDSAVRVTPMQHAEVLVRLGDLLVHVQPDRVEEAEEDFREAQRIDPAFADAYAELGYVRDLEERYDEAATLFEKALALDPDDALTAFHFGRCLTHRARARSSIPESGTPDPDIARAQEMFGKAIQIRPGFAEAYVEYGRTFLDQGGGPGPAIHFMEAARLMLPARADIVANLAILYVMKGDRARARDLVDNVLAHMDDPQALQAARSRLEQEDSPPSAGAPAEAGATPAAPAGPEPGTGEPPESTDPSQATGVAEYNGQVARYNEAVERANRRDYKGAIEILESLLKQVQDQDLRGQVTRLLDTLRKDAGRMGTRRR